VDCGTNGNGKFSQDNPVAQPGIKNGAQDLHDFVGNVAITANSSDDDLNASVRRARTATSLRISGRSYASTNRSAPTATPYGRPWPPRSPEVTCPTVSDRLPAVPAGAKTVVDQRLAALDKLTTSAGVRIKGARPGVDVQLNNAVLTWLRAQRARLLADIATVIAANGGDRPTGAIGLADCDLSYGQREPADEDHRLLHQPGPALLMTRSPGGICITAAAGAVRPRGVLQPGCIGRQLGRRTTVTLRPSGRHLACAESAPTSSVLR
jgi:hypothetical protein